jgi:hypothetical protein
VSEANQVAFQAAINLDRCQGFDVKAKCCSWLNFYYIGSIFVKHKSNKIRPEAVQQKGAALAV